MNGEPSTKAATGRRPPARIVAWIVWGVTVFLTIAWLPLVRVAQTQEATIVPMIFVTTFILGFSTVGALITSRQPSNRIGLAYALLALAGATAEFAGAYAQIPFSNGVHVPAFRVAAWLGRFGFGAMVLPVTFVFLLFPDGRVPTPRWRPVLWVMLAAAGVNLIGYAITPGSLASGFTYTPRSVTNPFGAPTAWKGPIESITLFAGILLLAGTLLGVVALIFRFRRARGDERQQIRWLAYVGIAALGLPLLGFAFQLTTSLLRIRFSGDTFWIITFFPGLLVVMIGTPAASLISVMRYRLYDLDVVVKKTVIAGVLVVLLGAIAGLTFLTIGQFALYRGTSHGVSVAVGIAVGLLFVPVLRVSRRIADRIVYGGRATPYEVLTDFSQRMAQTYSTEDVLPRMAALLAAGTGAERVEIWLAFGGELRSGAAAPETRGRSEPFPLAELPSRGAFEVRHLGELLGAITLEMPANDPMNPSKERIVRDLADQAGLVLRNVRLIQDLRASRQRLVAAQDEERRKIERNLHDGAQQQLVALAVKLRLAQGLATTESAEETGAVLEQLQRETNEALENLRDLARGIYPPLLADRGLTEALAAQARKAPLPVELAPDGARRYPQEVESAVYFCVLEALQNVAKYADASRATVRLREADGVLTFTVEDDGRGFDSKSVGYGTGLHGIADRLAALGGAVDVTSTPGGGTTVAGHLPVEVRT